MKKTPWLLIAGLAALALGIYYFVFRKPAAAGAPGTAANPGPGQSLLNSLPQWANKLINPSSTSASGDLQITNAKGQVTSTVPGGIINSVLTGLGSLFKTSTPNATANRPAAPTAAAVDSSSTTDLINAGEDMASGDSVQSQADWFYGTTQEDIVPNTPEMWAGGDFNTNEWAWLNGMV